jgi:hypothetical protein
MRAESTGSIRVDACLAGLNTHGRPYGAPGMRPPAATERVNVAIVPLRQAFVCERLKDRRR